VLDLFFLTAFLSGDLEVNVDFLVQIDKLVQLIESPIFTCKYHNNFNSPSIPNPDSPICPMRFVVYDKSYVVKTPTSSLKRFENGF